FLTRLCSCVVPSQSHFSFSFFLCSLVHPLHLHSFPTRRSSDLSTRCHGVLERTASIRFPHQPELVGFERTNELKRQHRRFLPMEDRKSTRLNSSHQIISYAVFCLKKKKRRIRM